MNAPHAIRINSCVRRTSRRHCQHTSLATAATNYELWGVVSYTLSFILFQKFFFSGPETWGSDTFQKKKNFFFPNVPTDRSGEDKKNGMAISTLST